MIEIELKILYGRIEKYLKIREFNLSSTESSHNRHNRKHYDVGSIFDKLFCLLVAYFEKVSWGPKK